MRKIKKIIFRIASFVAVLFFCSCSSDNDHIKDFNNMKLGKMDLTDAVSIGLKTNSNSRAIDGEFMSAGLYKVDKNGKITAVGVYFTNDKNGNRLEKEYALRVAPKDVCQVSPNYMLAIQCDYYDSDGDFVSGIEDDKTEEWINQEVPYKDLLVRLSDGKIWCVDDISEYLYDELWEQGEIVYRYSEFKEDTNGSLYCRTIKDYISDASNVYKFNLSLDIPAFEQVNTTPLYGQNGTDKWDIYTNDVIWQYDHSYNNNNFECHYIVNFYWQKSGFQTINVSKLVQDYSFIFPDSISVKDPSGIKVDYYFENREQSLQTCINNSHSPIVIMYPQCKKYKLYPNIVSTYLSESEKKYTKARVPLAIVYDFIIGDNPGSSCDNPIEMYNAPDELIAIDHEYFYMTGSASYSVLDKDKILAAFSRNNTTWISQIDLQKRTWEWLKKLDNIEINIDESHNYKEKLWIDDSNPETNYYGVKWMNPTSYEIGSVQFNVQIPEYMRKKPEYNFKKGLAVWQAQNPADGVYHKLVVDITTGTVIENSTSAPDLLFKTIISLN